VAVLATSIVTSRGDFAPEVCADRISMSAAKSAPPIATTRREIVSLRRLPIADDVLEFGTRIGLKLRDMLDTGRRGSATYGPSVPAAPPEKDDARHSRA
jgi:hypothetical protein